MLHTKFCGNGSTGSRCFWWVFTIYGHGGHLGHVTSIMLINFLVHKVNIQNLVENCSMVPEKKQV